MDVLKKIGFLTKNAGKRKEKNNIYSGTGVIYTVMHKNTEVLDVEIHEKSTSILDIVSIHNKEHVPVGLYKDKGVDIQEFIEWWGRRSIPISREGLGEALEALGVNSTFMLVMKCLGLSLSDHYWIKQKNTGISWDDVNFYDNDFSTDVGEALLKNRIKDEDIDLLSPDSTTNGVIRKKWIKSENKTFLIKGGRKTYRQEPYNEVIASIIMSKLGIHHVKCDIYFENGKPYSICENMTTTDMEFVPAYNVNTSVNKVKGESKADRYRRACEEAGLGDCWEDVDKMLVVDYIIANDDRHFNNFGFLRNSNSLEWVGAAPIFDSGNSMWYDRQKTDGAAQSKPFEHYHDDQIKLVSDLKWYSYDMLSDVKEEIMKVFSEAELISEERAEMIATEVDKRCMAVEKMKGCSNKQLQVYYTHRNGGDL